jgi:SAM-dependent methyltransferase
LKKENGAVACPVCSSVQSTLNETYGGYRLYLCGNCDVVFADPMKSDISFYESSADYIFRDKLKIDPLKWDYRWDIQEFFKNLSSKKGRLLDMGCGTGFFVKRAADMGFEAYGIEFNERSVSSGRKHFGLDTLYATDLESFMLRFPGLKFDVVTLFQVLEHLEDPNLIMGRIKQVVTENSVIVIAVPLRGRWPDTYGEWIDRPPHHLTRWSLKAMDNFLNKNGFFIRRHNVEKFPLKNMANLIYSYILKIAPSLIIKGSADESDINSLSEEQALRMLKKRKIKHGIANIIGLPLWVLLRLLGAKGPNLYVEACPKR